MNLLTKDGEALSELSSRAEVQTTQVNRAEWFAVYVGARHEKHVNQQLLLRQIEAFLPLYSAVHRWKNGCRAHVELPLFPNYLFVRVVARERTRILQIPGVVSMVCCGHTPIPIPAAVIEALRSAIALHQIEPHPYLVVGERVRIKSGPLAGVEGVLVRKKENLRVVLNLDHIMQSAAVEVDGSDVESLNQSSQCGMAN